jgi:hypothetical protein
MEPEILKALVQLGTYGPLGIGFLLFVWLFIQERKKTAELTAKLLEFAQATVQAENEHTKGWEALGNLYQMGIKSAEINTNVINSLNGVKEGLDEIKDELRRRHESKGR